LGKDIKRAVKWRFLQQTLQNIDTIAATKTQSLILTHQTVLRAIRCLSGA